MGRSFNRSGDSDYENHNFSDSRDDSLHRLREFRNHGKRYPLFDFYMEFDATNRPENTLLLRSGSSGEFLYSLSAVNVDAEVALDTVIPVQEQTQLKFEEEGEYTINVKVYLADGTFYHEKTLTWKYDQSIEMAPTVGFSEEASNDEHVNLLIAGNVSQNVDEIWIEGDLDPEFMPEGI